MVYFAVAVLRHIATITVPATEATTATAASSSSARTGPGPGTGTGTGTGVVTGVVGVAMRTFSSVELQARVAAEGETTKQVF